MLGMVMVAVLAQSGECRFKADWWLPTPVETSLGRLDARFEGAEIPAPKADVSLTNSGANVSLVHRGAKVKLFVKQLPVSSKSPLQFGFGYRPARSSLLTVTRVDGAFVEVVPWLSPGSSFKRAFRPKRVACTDLRLSAPVDSGGCGSLGTVDVSMAAGGEPIWTVNYGRISVDSDGRTVAVMVDGTEVRGWSKEEPGAAGEFCTGRGCWPDVSPRRVCDAPLTLFTATGERVGVLQAHTPFRSEDADGPAIRVRADGLTGSLEAFVTRDELSSCGD